MDVIRNDVVMEIKGNSVKQLNVHWVVREFRPGNMKELIVQQPQFRKGKMVNQGVPGSWWNVAQ